MTGRPASAEAVADLPERFVQVQVATSERGSGRVGVVTTDLETTQVVVIDPAEQHPQIRTAAFGEFIDEVLALLPPVPGAGDRPDDGPAALAEWDRSPVDVPQEYSIALAHALKVGDAPTVAAISEDLGWAEVPTIVVELARDLVGSAQLLVRSSPGDEQVSVGSLLLLPSGWVELLPVGADLIRHAPVDLDDLRARLLSTVTTHLERLVGSAPGSASAPPADPASGPASGPASDTEGGVDA
jgi:hypothetical protein